MTRLVKVDEIKLPQGFFEKYDNVPQFYEWLDTLPTVDAVEVIRCKDCKYYDANCPYPVCVYFEVNADGNDFCSWGERREAENDFDGSD